MRLLIEQSSFMDVEFIEDGENYGSNSDRFTFKLRAQQPIQVNGKEVEELSFDIIGPIELNEFLRAMTKIKKVVKR